MSAAPAAYQVLSGQLRRALDAATQAREHIAVDYYASLRSALILLESPNPGHASGGRAILEQAAKLLRSQLDAALEELAKSPAAPADAAEPAGGAK